MADDRSRAAGPAHHDAQWTQAFRRIQSLQRIQLTSLAAIGMVVVLATLGSAIVFSASAGRLEERERERSELVAIGEEARELQIEILRREANGDFSLSASDVLRLTSLAATAENRAIEAGATEAAPERAARREVVTRVRAISDALAGSDPGSLEGLIVDGTVGALIDQAFGALSAWVTANSEAVADERNRQQSMVTAGGLTIGALVLALVLVGLLVWWLTERARARVVAGARAQSRRYDSLIGNASDVVMVAGEDRVIEYCSPSVDRILGHDARAMLGLPLVDLIHPDDLGHLEVLSTERLPSEAVSKRLELRLKRVDGSWMEAEVLVKNLLADDAVGGFVLNCRDVSDRKEVEARLAHQALHDDLTGLPNRAMFEERLQDALQQDPLRREPVGVLVVDLDGFKTVNDTLGHDAGDEMLNIVAQRLQRCIRPGDTPARLGGDEFSVILRGLAGPAAVRMIAERIADAVREPMQLKGQEFRVASSIGIALSPRHGEDSTTIRRRADIAMYAAKVRPGVHVALFDLKMEQAFDERMRMGVELDRAVVAGDQFRVVYQPIVDLETEEIIALEALVRWDHPDEGVIMPDRFVPLAESNGLIVEIGEHVLHTACADAVEWTAAIGRELAVSVNVSARQLEDPRFSETVADALAASGLAPGALLLEITESAVMGDVDQVVAMLNRIRDLGVRIAIDDFGTGYSSLSQLRRLPIDMVKIDKEFIDDLAGESASDVTSTILQLGSVLELDAVAEGIERREQVESLRALRCTAGQGFLFAAPMSAAEVFDLLGQESLTAAPASSDEAGEQ